MSKEGTLSKRHDILKSASLVVKQEGIANLTLSAVAKQAGISKGGLLYHFPSKESLIEAMINDFLDDLTASIKAKADSDPNPKGRWARAYVHEVFTRLGNSTEANAGLIAAISTNPDMLEPIQQKYQLLIKYMDEDGIDPTAAAIIRLAADGLKYNALFGLPALQKEEWQNVLKALIHMTGENGEDKI